MTLTYNFPDKHLGGVTYGGYSDSIVVDERFVLHVPGTSISPGQRLFSARASRLTLPCATGAQAKARKSA
jgi:D-arabinose 1-dehydrogenase-like Zn-dependent alcohol dehydrogenase